MPFQFMSTALQEVILVEPAVFHDARGFFMESYKQSDFYKNGIAENFVQDNQSLSQKHVLRGLHYQTDPKAQGKLVSVARGRIFDVAVDIRRDSKTFKQWIGVELSAENRMMLYIPPGFAHGFVTLNDEAHICYKCTKEYSPAHDAGIRWDDPEIGVKWPVENPTVSPKDMDNPYLKDAVIF